MAYKINWKNISAMRDKIAHNYRGIDESMVWETVTTYLPVLKELLIEMLPILHIVVSRMSPPSTTLTNSNRNPNIMGIYKSNLIILFLTKLIGLK